MYGGDSTQTREPREKREVLLVFRKGKFNLEHIKFEHLRVTWAVRSVIGTCLFTPSKGWSLASQGNKLIFARVRNQGKLTRD